MLKAKSVYFRPHGVEILPPTDVEFAEGQLTALLGPNGAGKSTLLKLLSGDISCRGEVIYHHDRLQDLTIKALARRRVVLPQESFLSFSFSVREVVSLGDIDDEAKHLIDRCLEEVDLLELSERSYLTLSGGQKQRCQMARVLLQIYDSIERGFKPVVFLDEPTSALDMPHQHHILKVGYDLSHQQELCVIVVLHDLNLASQYADRIVMLKDGKVVQDGSVLEVMTEENVSQVYDYEVEILQHKGKHLIIPKNLVS